ncbi:MAG: PAS domain-containing protein [Chlorobiaceae bacterium]|nr:PAS domain-containing protein [Chlorobiaceae bacterium]
MSSGNNDFFLFKDYSEPAFIIDPEGTILEANAVFSDRFFEESGDVRGLNVFDLIANIFKEPGLAASRKIMVDKVIKAGKYTVFDDESGGRFFRNSIYPLKTPKGIITRLLIVVRDITAQVESEKKARKTDLVYKALLNAIPGSVFVIEDDCLIHTCNDYALEIFGDHNGEIHADNFLELIFHEDQSRIKEKLADLVDSGFVEVEEARMHTLNNRKRYDWFSINAQRAVIDSRTYLVLVCMDINQLKNDETRLIGYKKWMLMAMESGNTGLWDWNIKTGDTLWSNKIWELYGIEKSSALFPSFKLWETSVHPDDRNEVVGALMEAVKLLADLNIEYRVVHRNGAIRWILVNGKPVFNSNGEVDRYCGIAIDVTDQKQLEEEIGLTREHLYLALEKLHIGWFHTNLKDYTSIRTLEHARIFGYDSLDYAWSFEEFLKHIVDEDRERVKNIIFDSISNNKDFIVECQINAANGEKRTIWASAFIQYDSHGKASHILGMVQDITDRLVLINRS